MTDLRCLVGWHSFETQSLDYKIRKRTYGLWTLRRKCRRCPAKLVIEGPAAEIKAHIRGPG